jgi:hypothetical protein
MKYDSTDSNFQELVLEALRSSDIEEVIVTFTKADGTDRTMACTLYLGDVPSDKHPKGTGAPSPDGVQRVFDIDKQEWRSFKWDSVKSAEYNVQ